ncbi:MAG: lipoate--protein ligase [Erysipelotrichaceae bacterium]|nr:lipoate--protein ligase [Erysipelotrichaceae bacterium]
MKHFFVTSSQTNPFINLAYEDYMLHHLKEDECLFYLWQNHHTVVIGKNQNAYKECKVEELEASGGYLARRSSGGGAVYHDHGNLNFTFIAPKGFYSLENNLKVIIEALQSFGIHASFSGRNDIEVEGFKVSGNAFANTSTHSLHHGTLLFDVKMEDLGKYLNVSSVKLSSKGVESVRKRVKNLKEFYPSLTLEQLSSALTSSYNHIFDTKLLPMNMDLSACDELIEFYSSKQFRLEAFPHFEATLHKKFNFGEVVLFLKTKQNIIEYVQVYTDSLIPDLKESLEAFFLNQPFKKDSLLLAVIDHEHEEALIEIIQELFMS